MPKYRITGRFQGKPIKPAVIEAASFQDAQAKAIARGVEVESLSPVGSNDQGPDEAKKIGEAIADSLAGKAKGMATDAMIGEAKQAAWAVGCGAIGLAIGVLIAVLAVWFIVEFVKTFL